MQYLLCRLEDDDSTSFVSEHADIVSGIAEGKRIVESVDFDYPYTLLDADTGCRVSTFGKGRIGYREWYARRYGISSLEDKLDKQVEEILSTS